MGIHLDLVNQDEVFDQLSIPPVIVNDIDVSSDEGKNAFNEMITTRYEGDSLNTLPTCDCGELQGEYNVGRKCGECHTTCQHQTERTIESRAWIRSPDGVHGMLNPIVWMMMAKYFTQGGVNLVEWLCNPHYRVDKPNHAKLNKLKSFGFERGLNYFHDNFDVIMETLFNMFQVHKKRDLQMFRDLLIEKRDCVFSHYIPIPSKIAFVMERSNSGILADDDATIARDAICTISSINNSIKPLDLKQRESRASKTISQLAEYYNKVFGKRLAKKEGWFRKHIYGSRLHFSFRAVIISLSINHDYDELHLPWSLSVGLFKTHLLNKLLARGFDPTAAVTLLQEHVNKYSPLIDELFKELIEESPTEDEVFNGGAEPTLDSVGITVTNLETGVVQFHPSITEVKELSALTFKEIKRIARKSKETPYLGKWVFDLDIKQGIPVIFQRNPTLARGSAQSFRVTKIISDPKIHTVSMSVLTLSAPNADLTMLTRGRLLCINLLKLRSILGILTYLTILNMQLTRQVKY